MHEYDPLQFANENPHDLGNNIWIITAYLRQRRRIRTGRFELQARHFQWLVSTSDENAKAFMELPNTEMLHYLYPLREQWRNPVLTEVRYQDNSNYTIEGFFGSGSTIRFTSVLPSTFVFERYNTLLDDKSFIEMVYYGACNVAEFDTYDSTSVQHASRAATALREFVNEQPTTQPYMFTDQQQRLIVETIGNMKPYDLNSDVDGLPSEYLLSWALNVIPCYHDILRTHLSLYPHSSNLIDWDNLQTLFQSMTNTVQVPYDVSLDL